MFDGDTFTNLRLPMFFIALGFVMLYQVYQKKRSDRLQKLEEENMTIAQRIAKQAGGKLSAKTKQELAELEAMERSLTGFNN